MKKLKTLFLLTAVIIGINATLLNTELNAKSSVCNNALDSCLDKCSDIFPNPVLSTACMGGCLIGYAGC